MTDIKQPQITFYKLKHATDNSKECYVGSTTNFHHRWCNHKSNCNNSHVKAYNLRVYQYIRANGGFDSWVFEILEQSTGLTNQQKLTRERELTVLHSAKLNTRKAGAFFDAGDKKEYNRRQANTTNTCDKCEGTYRGKAHKNIHERTQKCQRLSQIRNQPSIVVNGGNDIHIHIHV